MWALACVTYEAVTGAKLFDVSRASLPEGRKPLPPGRCLSRDPSAGSSIGALKDSCAAVSASCSDEEVDEDEDRSFMRLVVHTIGPAPDTVGQVVNCLHTPLMNLRILTDLYLWQLKSVCILLCNPSRQTGLFTLLHTCHRSSLEPRTAPSCDMSLDCHHYRHRRQSLAEASPLEAGSTSVRGSLLSSVTSLAPPSAVTLISGTMQCSPL